MKPFSFTDTNILDRSIVISASAGSGKTFTLSVTVLLTLGRMQARPYEIYAATFSEVAAADLRERLLRPLDLLASLDLNAWNRILPINADFRDIMTSLNVPAGLSKSVTELTEAAPHFGVQPWMDTAASAQTFWRKTRREAELMHVSTLHALALGLLGTGRGAPDRILEADHPALLRVLRQALREIADVPENHPDYDATKVLLQWAEKHWELISQGHDSHRDSMGHNSTGSIDESRAQLKKVLKKICENIRPFADNPELAKNSKSRYHRYFDPKKILSPPSSDSTLSEQLRWAERQSRILDYPTDKLPTYYSTEFVETLEPLSLAASAWEAWLRTILAKALEKFEELKQKRAIATFGDIVRSALEGLNDGSITPPRPKLLMVDEYQDTSYAQDAFLCALGAERIVRVGDVKQAIYGFRGSSPALLKEHIEAAGDCAYRLTENFRSAPPIVDMANTFVKELWPAKDDSIGQMEAEQIPRGSGDCPIGAVLATSASRGTDLPSLSQWIATLSFDSGWENTYGQSSSTLSASSRALLLRQRTKLPILLMHLKRHGIQPYVLSKEGFWDSPGIRLIMTALEAFAHPDRPLPCAVLLRHFVALTDRELHGLGTLRGIGHLDMEMIPDEKRSEILWLQSLMTASTQEIAAHLLARGSLLAIVASLDIHGAMEPSRARRNLAGFLAMLQDLPASPATAFDMLDELRMGTERGDLPSTSQDADLIIQTVHGSKGLEYDDVILPLLNNKKTSIRKGRLHTDRHSKSLLFAWKLGNEPGSDYKKIADDIELQQRRDDLNLFYVAITRAKKRLCLLIQTPETEKPKSRKDKERPHDSWADLGKELMACSNNLLELRDPPPISKRVHSAPLVPERHLAQSTSPEKILLKSEPITHFDFGDHAENSRSRKEGEAMHSYLQNLLVRWEDSQAFHGVLNNPPEITDAKEIATRFFEALESRGWRHLRRRTEMNLPSASLSGSKGRADLVIWDNDTIHIIDFKHIHKLNAESAVIYSQQLNRYAEALNRHNATIKGWLVLLKSGVWKEIKLIF